MGHSCHQNFLTNSLVLSNPVLFASENYDLTKVPLHFVEYFNISAKNQIKLQKNVKLQSPVAKSTGFERTSEFVRNF